jgi:hypothetical protein
MVTQLAALTDNPCSDNTAKIQIQTCAKKSIGKQQGIIRLQGGKFLPCIIPDEQRN